jgi:peroxiredoxin
MDDAATLKKFKESLKAPFAFVADPDGKVVKAYDVKTPVLSFAQRYTFVIGDERKVLKVESGSDAINPEGAVVACPLRKPSSKPDAGTPPDAGK